jgi:5'-methylthioadenosine/S-adenosylhomocysteine nucleosidase
MTLVLGALDGEIEVAVSGLKDHGSVRWNDFEFHTGTVHDREVVVARSGVGKSLAALICQHLVDEFHPDRIIFTGIAGSLSPDLETGDTIIARDCLTHDLDATRLGFRRGEIPHTPYRVLACDPGLVQRAAALSPLFGRARVGRVLTGDQFVADAQARSALRQQLDGDAVEMEGASVGLVAIVNRLPFLLIRTISDTADGSARVDIRSFLKLASRNAWHYLSGIIATL